MQMQVSVFSLGTMSVSGMDVQNGVVVDIPRQADADIDDIDPVLSEYNIVLRGFAGSFFSFLHRGGGWEREREG